MNIATGLILVAAGVLVVVVGRLTATGRIGRNNLVGIRTARSKADDESWLIVHRAAQPWMIGGGVALAVGGVVAAAAEPARTAAVIVGAVLLVVLVIAGTVAGHAALRHRDLPR
ncbi:SdpI family protein [Actinomadura sp. BRA 177]|uniref:SdpI family protein n=1 Tax=Actinomadura sp. BRA 177 TaxID=2745202 RepID=UPI0015960EBD|nr:SdpI family protein [Actinomadura sp. BRA 177]NVI89819.1 SdpI family protein [Actinomadura sp. BRA 177]